MSEFRHDPLRDRHVLVLDEEVPLPWRRPPSRPLEESATVAATLSSECPFCPGSESACPPEILRLPRDARQPWRTRVFPNATPFLRVEDDGRSRGHPPFEHRGGLGAHEVLVMHADHGRAPADLTAPDMETALWTLRERLADLARDVRLAWATVGFRAESDPGAGVETPWMVHPHAQILALPFVPPAERAEAERARRHAEEETGGVNGGVPLTLAVAESEIEAGVRVVEALEDVVAYCPFASASPFEVWIVPRRDGVRLVQTARHVFSPVAGVLLRTLRRIRAALGNPSVSVTIRGAFLQSLGGVLGSPGWRIEVKPVLLRRHLLTVAAEVPVQPVAPEKAAETLRAVPVAELADPGALPLVPLAVDAGSGALPLAPEGSSPVRNAS